MKFKAASDFRNTEKFKIDGRKEGDPHIAKGDTFDADVTDNRAAEVIAILGFSGRIIDVENQPAASKRIDAEVAAEKLKLDESLPVYTYDEEVEKRRKLAESEKPFNAEDFAEKRRLAKLASQVK
jgi:hypothetical protein